MNIPAVVKSIQDAMRQDHGLDGDAQRLGQLCWMLFLRAIGSSRDVPERFRWDSLVGSERSGDELLDFVNLELIPGLAGLKPTTTMTRVIASIFGSVTNYMESPSAFYKVVTLVDSLNVSDRTDRHAIGEAYETLLSKLQSAGNAGEFYTPRPLSQAIVEVIDPRPGERILDPASGTGGFLVNAAEHLRSFSVGSVLTPTELMGVEKKALPYLLAQTNMLFHDIPSDGVVRGNLLAKPFAFIPPSERVEIILSNPPYGALEDASSADNAPAVFRSRDTTDLFLSLIMARLTKGGRAAVIVPDGFLFGTGAKARLRESLLTEYNLHTVLRLPEGVFSPYTNIRTNVLFFNRESCAGHVWFYELGLPDGKPYTKTRPLRVSHMRDFITWWHERNSSQRAWSVLVTDLAETGYRLDLRNPVTRTRIAGAAASALTAHVEARNRYESAKSKLIHHLEAKLTDSAEAECRDLVQNLDLLLDDDAMRSAARVAVLQCGVRCAWSTQDATHQQSVLDELEEAVGRRAAPVGKQQSAKIGRSLTRYPANVPDGWVVLPVSELGLVTGGGTPRTSLSGVFATEDGYPWLTPADLRGHVGKYATRGRRNLTELGLRVCGAKLLPSGTILFSSRAPIGYVAITAQEIATNQGFKSIIPFLPSMTDYLYYCMKSSAREIDINAPGTTFREVSGRALGDVLLPIPPMPVQREIAKGLDEIEGMFEELDRAGQAYAEALDDVRRQLLFGFDI